MPKNKLKHFAELKTLPNVFDTEKQRLINWREHFLNNNPIILELGCGKGDYTLALARLFPRYNFIGVDIKGARLWRGAKTALEQKLNNAAFLRTRAEWLDKYFESGTMAAIWLTFPDPFPKDRQAKHRLTHPRFLKIYKNILLCEAAVHLKTDDLRLFNYSIETALAENWEIKKAVNNLYAFNNLPPELKIQTFYEKQHLAAGRQIHYLEIKNML